MEITKRPFEISQRILQAHCQSPASQRYNQNFVKELAKPTHNRHTTMTKEEHRTDNSVYVAIAGEVVNRRSVLLRNFVLNGQESASNPLLHIHANRYRQA
jgi:hypothetical protein